MVRHYVKKSNRGSWDKDAMATALFSISEGRMSSLDAANAYNIPEPTLRRRLKRNDDDIPVHGGRFREVFSEAQQEDLKNYLTTMDKMFFGLTKKQCRSLVFEFAEDLGISHPFNKETKLAGQFPEEVMSQFVALVDKISKGNPNVPICISSVLLQAENKFRSPFPWSRSRFELHGLMRKLHP